MRAKTLYIMCYPSTTVEEAMWHGKNTGRWTHPGRACSCPGSLPARDSLVVDGMPETGSCRESVAWDPIIAA